MRKQIDKILDKINLIRETRKYENLRFGTPECGEALEEIRFAQNLLNEKKYVELQNFYDKKPFFFSVKILSEIINKHPDVKDEFISMVKENKKKFKRFFRELGNSLDDELSKIYRYDPNAQAVDRITFLRQFLSYSFVYQKGHITESIKEVNNIKDICEHISMDIIESFSEELVKSGAYKNNNREHLLKERRKFIDSITNEDNKLGLLSNASDDEKFYINRIIKYFKTEKECWQKVCGASPKKPKM